MKRINAILVATFGALFLFFGGTIFNQLFTNDYKFLATVCSLIALTMLVQLSLKKYYPQLTIKLVLSICISFFISVAIFSSLMYLLPKDSLDNVTIKYCINSFLTIFIIAYIEELIFRYFLLRVYFQYLNKHVSILLNSLVFSMIHAFNYNFYFLFLVFLVSLLFCYSYKYTNLFAVPIVLHFSFNLLSKINDEFTIPTLIAKIINLNAHIWVFIFLMLLYIVYKESKLNMPKMLD